MSCQTEKETPCDFFTQINSKPDLCGYVEVPNSWERPKEGTTKIAYAVYKSKSENRKPDPVIFIQGGPGGNVLSLSNIYSRLNLDADRDFILYDQRGIGFSDEICPNLSASILEVMAMDINYKQEDEEIVKRISECTKSLSSPNFNRSFGTIENVKDLETLREHLGYEQLNIFGGSYGTRLGLKHMELFPKSVRTATLSGLFPPEIRMYDSLVSSFNRSIQKVFETCETDVECNSKYPNLKNEFYEICKQLDKEPKEILVQGSSVVLNTQDMLLLLHQLMYNRQTMAVVPSYIMSFKSDNTNVIENAYLAFAQRASIINLATYWSVTKSDEGAYNNSEKIEMDTYKFPEFKSGISLFSSDPEILKDWPLSKVDKNAMQKVESDIPTLLISGDWDPITPPGNANLTARSLTNANNVVFPNDGHVVINSCFFEIAKSFINNPYKKVDDSCTKTPRPLKFN